MLTTHDHSEFGLSELLGAKSGAISVCIPTRNSGSRAATTVARLQPLREAGLIDQILLVDGSTDGVTGGLAVDAGAEAVREEMLLPELGPVLGKGDAMYRSLVALTGETVCFVDSDLLDFGPHYVTGLLGPLLLGQGCLFTKATYRRPLAIGDSELPDQGGRVTELTARPLLERFAPEAACFRQPLAGEVAGPRSLFESLSFCTGYGVEIAMLIDVVATHGLAATAEVDLGTRRNDHQNLEALAVMAREVVAGLFSRIEHPADRTDGPSRVVDRPPLARGAVAPQAA